MSALFRGDVSRKSCADLLGDMVGYILGDVVGDVSLSKNFVYCFLQ